MEKTINRGMNRRLALALVAATVAAVLLRTWNTAQAPLWLDESWSRWMAGQSWSDLRASARTLDTHPPFYYSVLKAWLLVFPTTPVGLRGLSILAGALMLPLAWLCARRISALRDQPWLCWFVTAAVAVSPALVIAARQARPYALFSLALVIALCASLAILRRREQVPGLWVAYALGTAATLWLHSLGIVFVVALGGALALALLLDGRARSQGAWFMVTHAVVLLSWLPALAVILEQRRNWQNTWLRFDIAEVPAGLSYGLVGAGLVGPLILITAILGAIRLLRSDRGPGLVLVAVAFGPAAGTILLSVFSSPVFLPRTLVPSVLPVLLLATAGLASLKTGSPLVRVTVLALGLLGITSVVQVTSSPEERWDQLAEFLTVRVQGREEVWLLPNEISLPLGYAHGSRIPYPIRSLPARFPAPAHPGPRLTGTKAVPGLTSGDVTAHVSDARARGVRAIWLVTRLPSLFDPENVLETELGTPADGTRAFAPITVQRYILDQVETDGPERPSFAP